MEMQDGSQRCKRRRLETDNDLEKHSKTTNDLCRKCKPLFSECCPWEHVALSPNAVLRDVFTEHHASQLECCASGKAGPKKTCALLFGTEARPVPCAHFFRIFCFGNDCHRPGPQASNSNLLLRSVRSQKKACAPETRVAK